MYLVLVIALQFKVKVVDRIQSVQALGFMLHHISMLGWVNVLELRQFALKVDRLASDSRMVVAVELTVASLVVSQLGLAFLQELSELFHSTRMAVVQHRVDCL